MEMTEVALKEDIEQNSDQQQTLFETGKENVFIHKVRSFRHRSQCMLWNI